MIVAMGYLMIFTGSQFPLCKQLQVQQDSRNFLVNFCPPPEVCHLTGITHKKSDINQYTHCTHLRSIQTSVLPVSDWMKDRFVEDRNNYKKPVPQYFSLPVEVKSVRSKDRTGRSRRTRVALQSQSKQVVLVINRSLRICAGMDLRLISVVIGSVLLAFPTVLVLGQLRSCTNRERCTAISDCPEFAKYVGTPYATWPESVLSNAKQMYCGSEQRGWTKVGWRISTCAS